MSTHSGDLRVENGLNALTHIFIYIESGNMAHVTDVHNL